MSISSFINENVYEGNEKYAFISYSHKDSDKVYSIVELLHKRGLRYWLDLDINYGTEWDDAIAEHINNAQTVIAFISANYIQSANCCDEIIFAKEKGINIILIYLEDVKLPLGMEMRMNRLQAVYWYEKNSKDHVLTKFFKLPMVLSCSESKKVFQNEITPQATEAKPYEIQPFSKRKIGAIGILILLCGLCIFKVLFESFDSNKHTELDPFDDRYFNNTEAGDLYLKYEGYSPNGYITIINNMSADHPLYNIEYSIVSPKAKEGDTVTITASSKDDNISLTRSKFQYTIQNAPRLISSPDEIDNEQLDALVQKALNYCKSDNSDPVIYDEKSVYDTQNAVTTYFEKSNYCDFFVHPDGRNELYIYIDRTITADIFENGVGIGNQTFNTLFGTCRLSDLQIDESGIVSYRYTDKDYMEFTGYYVSDKVFRQEYFNSIEDALLENGYTKYELVLQ